MPRRAFTLIEILVVVLILAITATIALDAAANTDASLRANRAAREAVTALRYARVLATTTGSTYGVEFDVGNKRFQVFKSTGSNVVTQSMTGGGTYVISLNNPELYGTTMTASITGDTTDPYDVSFDALGNTANNGTITFTFAGRTQIVTIPKVGDPTIK